MELKTSLRLEFSPLLKRKKKKSGSSLTRSRGKWNHLCKHAIQHLVFTSLLPSYTLTSPTQLTTTTTKNRPLKPWKEIGVKGSQIKFMYWRWARFRKAKQKSINKLTQVQSLEGNMGLVQSPLEDRRNVSPHGSETHKGKLEMWVSILTLPFINRL